MQTRLIFIFLIFGKGPIAQLKTMPPVIERLAKIYQPVTCFTQNNAHLLKITDLPESFNNASQSILKTKDHIYLQMEGTGRLYRLDKSTNGFQWTRLDSTYFTGYNFGAISFCIDSSFYSFGGNGFWHINGLLRYFNPKSREWNILPASNPFYFSKKMATGNDNFYFLDTLGKYLYVQGLDISSDKIKDPSTYTPFKNMLLRLNINNGQYDTLGKLNENKFQFIGTTPWGVFVNDGKVIDVKKNVVYRLSRTKKDEFHALMEKSTSRNNFSLAFFVDSLLYVGNYENKLDSMKLNVKDLIKEEASFYEPSKPMSLAPNFNKASIIIIISLIIIILFLLILLFGKKGSKPLIASIGLDQDGVSEEQNEKDQQVTFRSSKIIELLEQRERDLLTFIYKQSAEERLTSIEEINKVIGAAQRSAEIQKRLRSDLIISINDKLSIVTKSKKAVIGKQRSEFDKRSFEYFIQPEYMELVNKIIE